MKILHILDHSVPVHSGYAYRTLEILRQQRALGWETAHVTSLKHPGAVAPVEEAEGFRFYRTMPSGGRLERHSLLNPLLVIVRLSHRLVQVVRDFRPDLLHAHSPSLNGVAALHAGRRAGLPVVYEVRALWEDGAVDHGTTSEGRWRYRAMRALETWVLRRADSVTTICEGLHRNIVERGLSEDRVAIIPNAVDPKCFVMAGRRDTALARALVLEGTRILGFVGSFYSYEGLTVLLQALPYILERYSDVRVVLVGGGMQEAALKREAVELGVADKVIFTGWVPHDCVPAYYSLMDILVYPRQSVRLTELVTPLKPLEAMAQGRLVVASDIGGHRELIRQGETGWLFRAGDPRALAATVVDVFNHPEQAEQIRAAARRFVEVERTWEASVGRYAAVYRTAVEHYRAGKA